MTASRIEGPLPTTQTLHLEVDSRLQQVICGGITMVGWGPGLFQGLAGALVNETRGL